MPKFNLKQAVAAVGVAAAFICGFEGVKHTPYFDTGGVPTACAGHVIEHTEMQKIFTNEECYELLGKDTLNAAKAVDRLVHVPLTEGEKVAYISFVFNVGSGAFARSTMLKKLNSGDHVGACNQLPRFVYVGKKVVRGLQRRRLAEMNKCLDGL